MAWTCQRQAGGTVCKHLNPNRLQKCGKCGKRKPPRKKPAHLVALEDHDYASFIERTGGEFCAICGRKPNGIRKLHRDHDHRSGQPRELLCFPCNSVLRVYMTSEWLRKAADYLDRYAA